ncbi:fungal Zn binuclear cluster domain-containing protein [Dothistroma septosporum NZE10]|uniref:Fungal Zn binuclear cluster domain-containing protein n=1 Tax=Dothistroma septosporum (strain NZE10 / CBS 128990) TaxID=675120 RepID=N1PDV0_DOTSN|nr:fungal Zn binuclear cluster domain-containing protein [Dothistroma septosporum NZE10]
MSHHRGQLQCLNNTAGSYHSHTMTPQLTHSPVNKMAQPQRNSSQDSTADGIRKRVCKACDRCRLKKSKCDGSSPCSRCKADNAICVFGERKKSHDKVYPKGYVEMLEQQQAQLVNGLQEMYRRLRTADAWEGEALSDTNGAPLTHDILAALGLLEPKHDGSGELETFEDDCESLQSRLIAQGAGLTQRRGSFSSESEHSQHGHARSASRSTPSISKPPTFKQESLYHSAPPSPPQDTPAPVPAPRQQRQSFTAAQLSPLQQNSPLSSTPQFYQDDWYTATSRPELMMRSDFAMQTPDLEHNMGNMQDMTGGFASWDTTPDSFDMNMATFTAPGYPGGHPNAWSSASKSYAMDIDPMDAEFAQFIQVVT